RTGQQTPADQLQSDRFEIGYFELVIETPRQPLDEMRPLASGDLDGMAYLDHVDPVGIERLCGEGVEAARRCGRCSVCHPPDRSAREKCYDHRGGGNRTPGPCTAGQFVKIEARGDRLRGECAEACADCFGLRAPLGDTGSIFRMRGEPRLDGVAA